MIDKNMLAGKIVSAGFTQRSVAKLLGINENTLSAKINGRRFFNTEEVIRICEILSINSPTERSKIFLSKSSHNRDDQTA